MQTTVKDTYSGVQSRIMYLAFLVLTLMSIVLMSLEAYNMAQNDYKVAQIIIVMSIFIGILYSLAGMLIVEVVYQEDFHQIPIFSHLGRLTPDLLIVQRYTFLALIFKSQITSVVALMTTWIIVGGTHRAGSLVFAMTLITMFTRFGVYHLTTLPPPPPPPPETTGQLIDRRMSD
jgi:hypothetical protein